MSDRTNVLVVDDNEDLAQTLSLVLKWSGYSVDTAEDGLSALDKFKMCHFDVALMDIVMPRMNGIEAFRRMKEIDPEVRVILMTAYYQEELIKMALNEGTYGAVYKPIDIARMVEMIREACLLVPQRRL